MSDTPTIVTQAENIASLVAAEVAKANAARAAGFHALIAEFGIRAVYLGLGAVALEVVRLVVTHSF